MARPSLLDESVVSTWLADHTDWTRDGDMLKRHLTFANFRQAFGFMTQVAMIAEKLDHHPEWSNVYSRVDLAITTHDAGGLTQLDLSFAEAVEAVLST